MVRARIGINGNGSMNMNMKKRRYYNEYYDDDFDLIATEESTGSESHWLCTTGKQH